MKKIVKVFCLMALSLLFVTNVALAQNTQGERTLATTGKIVNVSKTGITVEGKGNFAKVVLNINADTFLLDGKDGSTIDKSKLQEGIQVTGYYTPVMTKSIPPQTNAKAVVLHLSDDTGMYFIADKVEQLDDGVRILNSNCDQFITITNEVLPNSQAITQGQQFLAWYRINALSMPAQDRATKVVLLKDFPVDIIVSRQAGVAAVNGHEFQVLANKGEIYLPARDVCQALGYKVTWQNNTVTLEKNFVLVDFMPTSNVFVKDYEPMIIQQSAKVIDGKTYLPLEFFTKVLGLKVKVNNNHV